MNSEKFNVNDIKGIETLHNYIQSQGNLLELVQLKELLVLTRSSRCHSSKKISLQQLQETEERLEKFIKEKTPWYQTNPFYIGIALTLVGLLFGLLLECISNN